jgi:hypothetical protein
MNPFRLFTSTAGLPRRARQALGLGILFAAALGDAHAIDTRPYFPLDLGSTWTLRGTTEQQVPYTTVSTTVAGKTVDGKRTTKMFWESDEADETDRVAHLYFQDASGTQIMALEPMPPKAMRAECVPVPAKPYLLLPGQVTIGQRFSGTMTSRCEGVVAKFASVSTIVGFATTVVPAGTFRTLILKTEATTSGTWQGRSVPTTKQVVTWYLARGIGVVKEVTESFVDSPPFEKATGTEVLVSTNRKYDPSGY